jgi:hypothetical protein
MTKNEDREEMTRDQAEDQAGNMEPSTRGRQLPDIFTVLRWVMINLPYAFAALLVALYYLYVRDFGQGLSTLMGILVFVLLFVVPFYIGEAVRKVPGFLQLPARMLHFVTVTGVQMAFVFLIVLTALIKDHVNSQALPEIPVSERLGGTPGLSGEEWPLVPEEGRTAPDEHLPDDREALAPERDEGITEEVQGEDDAREQDAVRKLFMNMLDRAELWMAVAGSGELGRFPLQTFFSMLMGLAAGFLSWLAFKKRPWRIKFQEAKYEEDEQFRFPLRE